MKRKLAVLAAIMLMLPAASPQLNEVMYNSAGSDNNKEFVEVRLANLTNYTIGDADANDTLELLKYADGNYSLIVEEGFNHTGINASIYSAGATIGNGLSNSQDSVYLYYSGSVVDNMSYDGETPENYSLELRNGSWQKSLVKGGTPGKENSQPIVNKSNNSNPTMNITNTTNSTTNTTETCNISIGIDLPGEMFYEAGERIGYFNTLTDEDVNYTITYGIMDLDGSEVRPGRETTNTDEKSFTPKTDMPEQAFVIWNELVVNCDNTGKNSSETILFVKNPGGVCIQEELCTEEKNEIKKLEKKVRDLERRPSGGGNGGAYFIEKEALIESFYTRKVNYDPVIKVFARLEGDGLYVLSMTSRLESFNRTLILNGSDTMEMEVQAEQGRNIYVLEMGEDMEKLIVEFPEEEEVMTETAAAPPKPEKKEPEEQEKAIETEPAVTGSMVYSSTPNAAPYLIGGSIFLALVLGGAAAWNWRQSFYKPSPVPEEHEERRDKGENSRGMDTGEHDIRGGWKPEKAHRGLPEGLHGEYQDRWRG